MTWKATEPPGTSVSVRVRSGDSEASLGAWFGPYDHSPAVLGSGAATPLAPNPAPILEVELTLQTPLKDATPVVHDFDVTYGCVET